MTDVTKSQLAKKNGTRTKPTAQLLRLVPKTELEKKPCKDTVETLEYLLQEAREGNLTGIAYGAMMPGRKFIVDAAGVAHSDPLYGIGVIQVLSHELSTRIRGA